MSLKLMYIDDENDLLDLVKEALSSAEVTVTTYTRAEPALRGVVQNRPDVILIDYQLPGMTGDDVADMLRNIGAGEIPKYIVSGNFQLKLRNDFVGVIQKPFKLAAIASLITHHVDLKRAG